MNHKVHDPEHASNLRRRADTEIARQRTAVASREDAAGHSPGGRDAESLEAAWATLHELRVHQIELELQNEELRQAQAELDAARAGYVELYDFAPVGYLTLTNAGLVQQANLTAATLVGVARSEFVRLPFSRFIAAADRDAYYLFCRRVFEAPATTASLDEPSGLSSRPALALELRMARPDGSEFWARLEGTAAHADAGTPTSRLAVSDISERIRAEEAMRCAHDELEQRVAERTRELREANEALRAEIARRERAEADLEVGQPTLDALWGIASLVDEDLQRSSDVIVASLVQITNSGYGFYAFVNDDETVMTIHAWSGHAMQDCKMASKPQQFSVQEAGIWGEAVRRRAPLILNDYAAAHPARKGLPEGHVQLTNLLVVPLFSRGRIRALAAVANRSADYGQTDVQLVTTFLGGAQAIVEQQWYRGGLAHGHARAR